MSQHFQIILLGSEIPCFSHLSNQSVFPGSGHQQLQHHLQCSRTVVLLLEYAKSRRTAYNDGQMFVWQLDVHIVQLCFITKLADTVGHHFLRGFLRPNQHAS